MGRSSILLFPALAAAAFAIPGIYVGITVANAASPEVGVSPGALASIRISGFPPPTFPEPESIQITFEPEAGPAILAGPILRVTATELRTVIPRSVPPGNVDVRILIDGTLPLSTRIRVAAAAPGLFTTNPYGDGPAVAQNHRDETSSLNSLTNPAVPEQDVTLWLTGLGDVAGGDVSVEIGGSPVKVTYAGHHQIPGLDQINIRIAADSFLGCYVPLVVRAGQTESNVAALAINSTPGACAHPLGISYSDLVTLDGGGSIMVGLIRLSGTLQSVQTGIDPTWSGSARAEFFLHDATAVFRVAQLQHPYSPLASCRMLSGVATPDASIIEPADAGPALTLAGPQARQLSLEHLTFYYSGLVPASQVSFFTPGEWRISAPGGLDLAQFSQAFQIPPAVRWTNRDTLPTIYRDRDAIIRWDPIGYGPSEILKVTLARPPGGIQCKAYAWQGQLSLPQSLLQRVQPTPSQGFLTLEVEPHPDARQTLNLVRTSGASVRAVVEYRLGEVREVAIE